MVIGAVLQGIGLGFVFVELAIIRSHEFGVPTPWARVRRRIHRWRGRTNIASGAARLSAVATVTARGVARPGRLGQGVPDTERIARLERYVEHLDRDVEGLHRAIDVRAKEISAAAMKREQELREESAAAEARRREALRRSVIRQAVGGVFVACGLVVGTLGSVAQL